MFRKSLCNLVCFFFLLAGVGLSQDNSGRISGTVTDNSGAVVPGAKIVVNDLDEESVSAAVAAIQDAGGRAAGAVGDVSKSLDVRNALAVASDTFGGLDILYNNAGIGRGGFFADQSFEDVMAVVNTNFVSVLIGIHEGIKYLKATPVVV